MSNKLSFAPVSISGATEYSNKSAVMMVDPRNQDLYPVLVSVEKQIPMDWDFYMFGSKANENAIRTWFRDNSKRRLHFLHIPEKYMHSGGGNLKYSEFLEDKWIWETIKAEHILLVQTDAAICDHGKININEFTKFPYIGAAYGGEEGAGTFWADTYPGAYFYGVGGITMRKRSFMLNCIKNNKSGHGTPEDVYFSTCLGQAVNNDKLKPNAKDMHKFGIETNYDAKYGRPSFAVHKPGLSMTKEDMVALRADCPAAWQVGLKDRLKQASLN